jgi:DNA (cytosine-5)-methyltransferase 1
MKSIELFSGAGGLALGIHLAGFEHQLLVEADHGAFETLRQNRERKAVPGISRWPVIHDKVESVNLDRYSEVDLLAAGIPCQPFSNGGKRRGLEDERNMFPVFTAAVATVRPRAFLLENVNGLIHGRLADHVQYVTLQLAHPWRVSGPSQTWREHLDDLRKISSDPTCNDASYAVYFQVLNAADYGVPQIRKRVFIVGFRRDLEVNWSFPASTHSREALFTDQRVTGTYWMRYGLTTEALLTPKLPNSIHFPNSYKPTAWRTVRDVIQDLPGPGPDDGSALRHVRIPGARSYRGHTGSDIDRPAKSLKAGVHGVGGGENMVRQKDGQIRYFTVRECARLQTFPDSWVFEGPWSIVTKQLGNAVPVTLAAAVAQAIKAALAGSTPVGVGSSQVLAVQR